jgi:hypothetical protein
VNRVAQSVYQLAKGWTVRGSNLGGGKNFRTCPDRSWGPTSLLYNGYLVFPGGRKWPGRDADPSPLLVQWSKNRVELYPLISLRAFVACKKGETYLGHYVRLLLWGKTVCWTWNVCSIVHKSSYWKHFSVELNIYPVMHTERQVLLSSRHADDKTVRSTFRLEGPNNTIANTKLSVRLITKPPEEKRYSSKNSVLRS